MVKNKTFKASFHSCYGLKDTSYLWSLPLGGILLVSDLNPVFNSSLTVGVYPEERATALQRLIPSPPQPAPIPSVLSLSPPRSPTHVFIRVCAFKSVFYRSSAATNLNLAFVIFCLLAQSSIKREAFFLFYLFIFINCREFLLLVLFTLE